MKILTKWLRSYLPALPVDDPQLAEDLTHHHHHLLCSSCGRVIDVTPTLNFEQTVSAMVEELARQQGFRASSHALDVIGHCATCLET